MSGSSAPPPPPLGVPPPPPPASALTPPIGLGRSGPSVVDPVPHEFETMVLPRALMQIPGHALYNEARKTITSQEQQIRTAKYAIYALNHQAEQAGIAVRLNPSDQDIIDKLKTEYTTKETKKINPFKITFLFLF